MSVRIFIVGICICMGYLSCEKDAKIDMHSANQELVVEGSIENNKSPIVVLTRSLNYFSSVNTSILEKLFVHGAKITVSDQNSSVQLVEHQLDTLNNNPYYYYSTADTTTFLGRPGKTYQLTIQIDSHTYVASTTIPSGGFYVDSVWWVPGTKDGQPDSSKAYLMARIYDPQHLGNYARYYTKRNNEPFFPGLASVADDEVTNGSIFDFQLDRGVNKNMDIDYGEYGHFDPGDTVTLKFCNIDQTTYTFWSTWEYAWSNNGNPFATPTTVQGNVPGALGYWGGYEAQYKTLIIPK